LTLLGADQVGHQSIAITPGAALSISSERLQTLMEEQPQIKQHLLKYIQALLVHSFQNTLCGLRHSLDRRLAGWICHTSDLARGRVIPVTHEHLSTMLGVRRASVTKALVRFENDGLIERARGTLRVRDRQHLGLMACSCFSTITEVGQARLKIEPSRAESGRRENYIG